jgi:levansucrase
MRTQTQSFWKPSHVDALRDEGVRHAPLIGAADVVRAAPGLDIWDAWPVQLRDGAPWRIDGRAELWMALTAPPFDDPDVRHQHARIHLFQRSDRWIHVGPAMPDGYSPGSREWSGSAIIDPATNELSLFFTAAGRRGEPALSFEQRMFSAQATVAREGQSARLTDWRNLREIISGDAHYMGTRDGPSVIGEIKAFRDPSYFYEPALGQHYIFFAGSLAGSSSPFNGVIGVAVSNDGAQWTLKPPVISADQLNNELERPHVVRHGGRYYMFWSTQRHVFNRDGPQGPTGLYGMTSTDLLDGWRPLNETGLVFSNPPEAPAQAYSWLVLPDLSVTSFVDDWGGSAERRFGGTFAPFLRLTLDGSRAALED